MIYISNPKKVNELKNKINKNNICVFMDFDKTITTGESQDSWAASANKKVLGENISNELDKYYQKYGPIEFDYSMDIKQREKYIIEWYDKCMDLYYKYHLTEQKLKEAILNSKLILREGAKDLLLNLYKNNIPVIILSAGIGNVIKQFLEKEHCYFDNIEMISNFIKFDKNGDMIKFSDNMIHSLNKNIDKLGSLKIKEEIKTKEYRIVIGDLVEDIYMIGEHPEEKTLKIGYLNKNITQNLGIYQKKFDIVLTEKSNFYDIEKYIINKNSI